MCCPILKVGEFFGKSWEGREDTATSHLPQVSSDEYWPSLYPQLSVYQAKVNSLHSLASRVYCFWKIWFMHESFFISGSMKSRILSLVPCFTCQIMFVIFPLTSCMELDWKNLWSSNTLAPWCEELTHWKRPWCWERLRTGGEGDNRGWDGWMASLTRWTWVWVSSGIWWWTGKPGVLRSVHGVAKSQIWLSDWTELRKNLVFWYSFRPILFQIPLQFFLQDAPHLHPGLRPFVYFSYCVLASDCVTHPLVPWLCSLTDSHLLFFPSCYLSRFSPHPFKKFQYLSLLSGSCLSPTCLFPLSLPFWAFSLLLTLLDWIHSF